jgi:hypothetical protein
VAGGGGGASGFNYEAYIDANPDLQAAFSSVQQYAGLPASKTGGVLLDQNGDGTVSKNEYGQFHWTAYGQKEGRTLPTYTAPTAQELTGLIDTGLSNTGRVVSSPAPVAAPVAATPQPSGGYVPIGGAPAATSAQAYAPQPQPVAALPAPQPVAAEPQPQPVAPLPAPQPVAPLSAADTAGQSIAQAPTNDVAVVQTPGLAQPELGGAAPVGAIPFQRSDLSVSFPTESRLASLISQSDVPAAQTDNAAAVARAVIDRSPRAQAAQAGYYRAGEDALKQQLAAGGVAGSGRGALALADYGGEFAARQYGAAYDDATASRDFAAQMGTYLDNFDMGRYAREVGERAYDQSLLNSEAGWMAGERGYGDQQQQQIVNNLMAMYNPALANNMASQGNDYAARMGQQQMTAANNQALAGVQQANIWGNAIGSTASSIGDLIKGTDWSKVFKSGGGSSSSSPSFNYGAGVNSGWWQ